jgi:hypothetical protein
MFKPNQPARQATRTLQTMRGMGKVYAGNQFVCDVRYTVTVHQGIVYAGSQPRTGTTDIKGTMVIVTGEADWKPGTKLSLKMEDGRTAACTITAYNAAAGLYALDVDTLSARS